MGVTKNTVFGPNEPLLEQCVEILIIEDEVVENFETFLVSLVSSDEDVTLQNSMATVTIIDDDCKTYIKLLSRPLFNRFLVMSIHISLSY